jgi:uncharacterized protein
MLLQLGPLQFSIAPMNAHELSRTASTDFAKKEVVGRRKIYEHMGEGDDERTIKGKLFPFKTGGLGALELMHQIRESGAPQLLVRGDGMVMGWFVITKIIEEHKFLSVDGVGQQIDVAVSIERADSPGAIAAFTSLFGLAP